jgi:hypothetical protein
MNELNNLPAGMLTAILVVIAVIVLAGIIIYCLYIKNLQDTLLAVRPQNRQMPAAQVWLLLISFLNIFIAIPGVMLTMHNAGFEGVQNPGLAPIADGMARVISVFVLFWQFRIVQKISASIAAEYASRNLQIEAKPAYQIGLAYCICSAAGLVLGFMPQLRMLIGLLGIVTLVLWIMYWVKTAEYKKAMKNMPVNADDESALFRDLY